MARGKKGASAAARHAIEALQEQLAAARRQVERAERERDDSRAATERMRKALADTQRALVAERDEAVSPRVRDLEQQVESWHLQFAKAGQETARQIHAKTTAIRWMVRHMQVEHDWPVDKDAAAGLVAQELNMTVGVEGRAQRSADIASVASMLTDKSNLGFSADGEARIRLPR